MLGCAKCTIFICLGFFRFFLWMSLNHVSPSPTVPMHVIFSFHVEKHCPGRACRTLSFDWFWFLLFYFKFFFPTLSIVFGLVSCEYFFHATQCLSLMNTKYVQWLFVFLQIHFHLFFCSTFTLIIFFPQILLSP